MPLPDPSLKRLGDSDTLYYLPEQYYLNDFYSKSLQMVINVFLPALLLTDGASIPRICWRIMRPLEPRLWVAFLVHDYLYGNTHLSEWEKSLTRKQCDLIFYDLLIADGVSKIKAELMYRAVRLGGWVAFRKKPNQFNIR